MALHHLNFYNKYLVVADKPMPKSLTELMLNEMVLVDIPFMVFSSFQKTIELDKKDTILQYL